MQITDTDRDTFTSGQCHALASAVHSLTGWQMVALIDGCGGHVAVRTPEGELLDIWGRHAEADAVAAWWADEVIEIDGLSELDAYGWPGLDPDAEERALEIAPTLI